MISRIFKYIILSITLTSKNLISMEETLRKAFLAAGTGNVMSLKKFIDEGIDVNSLEKTKIDTLLSAAAHMSNHENVEYLLNNGAKVNEICNPGLQHTPLIRAVQGLNYKDKGSTISLLIERGADVDAKDADGNSSLSIAITHLDIETVKILLEKNADIFSKNSDGETAFDIALELFKCHYAIFLDTKRSKDPFECIPNLENALICSNMCKVLYDKFSKLQVTSIPTVLHNIISDYVFSIPQMDINILNQLKRVSQAPS